MVLTLHSWPKESFETLKRVLCPAALVRRPARLASNILVYLCMYSLVMHYFYNTYFTIEAGAT